ncbi:hypothetical protein EV356DRAFT_327446 [Viridothelium virens]|uniref:Acylphosphatase-like domain-containing protein n=1 Tax=Viridothelium virens TaxID=1048519 RepID=A0A6A6GYE4_VIRVR|nr:hypothetical protein EV356DRAFT_327446 [Viridothelium virens]
MIPQPCVLSSSADAKGSLGRGIYSSPTKRRRFSLGSILSRRHWAKKRRLSFKIRGQEGVDFLPMICDQATALKVTGYCRNATDGSIRGEAQGDESQLNDFVTYLRKGPLAADLVGTEIGEIHPNYNEYDFCTVPDDYDDSGVDSSSAIYHTTTTPSSSALTSSSGGSAGTPGTSGSETRSTVSRASSGSVMKFQWKVDRVER